MRCERCGTHGEWDYKGQFVNDDWVRAAHLLQENEYLKQENKELKAKLLEVASAS